MVIANFVGISLFFYMIWKNLKDDYHYEKVFNLGFIGIILFALSRLASVFVRPEFWFWVSALFFLLGFLLVVRKQKMKFFETFEAYFVGLMPWLSLFYLTDSIYKSSLLSFVSFWVTLIYLVLYFYLKTYYRSFVWYKSGKVGFAGVVTLVLFFVTRLIASFFNSNLISMAGNYEKYLSGSTALLLIILMYNLFREND